MTTELSVYERGTDAQRAKYEQLKQRWDNVDAPILGIASDYWTVKVSSDSTGCVMWLGIETDGHCHS